MARELWEHETKTVVCTPHFYEWDAKLVARARETLVQVRDVLRADDIGLRLLLGFEVDLSVIAEADEQMLASLVIEGSAREDGSGGTLLLETPYSGWPPFIQETIWRLSTRGYLPILAHPERNERIQRSPELLADCLRAGAVAQGTAGSLSGMFRRSSARTFFELLARGDLSLLASDGHAQIPYTWSLASLLEELRKKIPEDYLDTLVRANPARVLQGSRPPADEGERVRTKSWWRR